MGAERLFVHEAKEIRIHTKFGSKCRGEKRDKGVSESVGMLALIFSDCLATMPWKFQPNPSRDRNMFYVETLLDCTTQSNSAFAYLDIEPFLRVRHFDGCTEQNYYKGSSWWVRRIVLFDGV